MLSFPPKEGKQGALRGMINLNAIVYRDESGAYCAEIPALPGCFSDGDTFEAAVANIREAAAGWLAAQDEANAVSHHGAVRIAL